MSVKAQNKVNISDVNIIVSFDTRTCIGINELKPIVHPGTVHVHVYMHVNQYY